MLTIVPKWYLVFFDTRTGKYPPPLKRAGYLSIFRPFPAYLLISVYFVGQFLEQFTFIRTLYLSMYILLDINICSAL
jgi:hypothetical protein